MKRLIAVVLALFAFFAQAHATAIFVGAFNVSDGPYWEDVPPVYSAREAAALVFGGMYSDYAISIDPSLDPATITHTAYYDGWGDHSGKVFDEDYKLDLGGGGYGSFDGDPLFSAYSAYVNDGLFAINYVWRIVDASTPIPEPTTLTMFILGLGLLALFDLRNKKQIEPRMLDVIK